MNEIKVVILLEGGLVQTVFVDTESPVRIAVVDFDCEGADPDELAVTQDGREFIGHSEPAVFKQDYVDSMFAVLSEN